MEFSLVACAGVSHLIRTVHISPVHLENLETISVAKVVFQIPVEKA